MFSLQQLHLGGVTVYMVPRRRVAGPPHPPQYALPPKPGLSSRQRVTRHLRNRRRSPQYARPQARPLALAIGEG